MATPEDLLHEIKRLEADLKAQTDRLNDLEKCFELDLDRLRGRVQLLERRSRLSAMDRRVLLAICGVLAIAVCGIKLQLEWFSFGLDPTLVTEIIRAGGISALLGCGGLAIASLRKEDA